MASPPPTWGSQNLLTTTAADNNYDDLIEAKFSVGAIAAAASASAIPFPALPPYLQQPSQTQLLQSQEPMSSLLNLAQNFNQHPASAFPSSLSQA